MPCSGSDFSIYWTDVADYLPRTSQVSVCYPSTTKASKAPTLLPWHLDTGDSQKLNK